MAISHYLGDGTIGEGIHIARGAVSQTSHINKFGFNNTVGTDFEILGVGSANFVYPTTAAVASVVSDDANDDDGDTGARTLSIQGLDGNYNEITETVTLNGTSAVTTTATFLRIFRARVETAGTSAGAEGIITVSVGGNEIARLDPVYDNQTLQAAYTVPAGKTAYLIRMQATSTKDNKSAMVGLFTRNPNTNSVFVVLSLIW